MCLSSNIYVYTDVTHTKYVLKTYKVITNDKGLLSIQATYYLLYLSLCKYLLRIVTLLILCFIHNMLKLSINRIYYYDILDED